MSHDTKDQEVQVLDDDPQGSAAAWGPAPVVGPPSAAVGGGVPLVAVRTNPYVAGSDTLLPATAPAVQSAAAQMQGRQAASLPPDERAMQREDEKAEQHQAVRAKREKASIVSLATAGQKVPLVWPRATVSHHGVTLQIRFQHRHERVSAFVKNNASGRQPLVLGLPSTFQAAMSSHPLFPSTPSKSSYNFVPHCLRVHAYANQGLHLDLSFQLVTGNSSGMKQTWCKDVVVVSDALGTTAVKPGPLTLLQEHQTQALDFCAYQCDWKTLTGKQWLRWAALSDTELRASLLSRKQDGLYVFEVPNANATELDDPVLTMALENIDVLVARAAATFEDYTMKTAVQQQDNGSYIIYLPVAVVDDMVHNYLGKARHTDTCMDLASLKVYLFPQRDLRTVEARSKEDLVGGGPYLGDPMINLWVDVTVQGAFLPC